MRTRMRVIWEIFSSVAITSTIDYAIIKHVLVVGQTPAVYIHVHKDLGHQTQRTTVPAGSHVETM